MASIPLGEFTYSLVLKNYETVTNTTTLVSKRHMNDFTFLRQVEPHGTSTVPVFSANVTELIATAPRGATILTMEGTVQIARKGSTEWLPAQTNMVLTVGERLRTRSRSRATLRLSDLSILRVDQLSELEIKPPGTNKLEKPSLQLKGGTLEFFKRDTSSNSIPVSTPNARIEIRG